MTRSRRGGANLPAARPTDSDQGAEASDQRLWLCTIGGLTIDDLVFWPSGRSVMRQPGGNSIYSALGARIWLSRVVTLTRMGFDYPKHQLEQVLNRVDLEAIPVNAPSMSAWGLYEADGGRQWVPHPKSGTQAEMTPIPSELPRNLANCPAFHLASMPPTQHLEWALHIRTLGALVSADSMQVEVLGSGSIGNEATHFTMISNVDFYLPSEVEAQLLIGSNDPLFCAKALAECGPRIVVIKLGSEGSIVYDKLRGRSAHVPALGSAIDPTGAGDAYCGGFLAGYMLSGDAVAAAQMAAVSASFAVESVGIDLLVDPSSADIRDRLEGARAKTSLDSAQPLRD